jgi:pyruvate dehydrogenase E1 component alpha subunit
MPYLRSKDEIEEWKQKCPVVCFENRLLEQGVVTRDDLKEINDTVMAKIEDAVRYALQSPLPAPQDALEDVFSA